MRMLLAAFVAAALCALPTVAARADDDDCTTVINDINEALEIATKNLQETLSGLKKIMSEGADDRKKLEVKNSFCSASGEMLGTSRALRAVVAVCGPDRRDAIASLDKSIAEMETSIGGTCK
jgi:hypothetical protein